MTNQCQHGQLARVCVTCEQAAEIATLRAEVAGLRAELLKSLADNAALRERVKVLEDALRGMVIANERHSFLRVGDALTAARAALEKP